MGISPYLRKKTTKYKESAHFKFKSLSDDVVESDERQVNPEQELDPEEINYFVIKEGQQAQSSFLIRKSYLVNEWKKRHDYIL